MIIFKISAARTKGTLKLIPNCPALDRGITEDAAELFGEMLPESNFKCR
jgi:hypothetical protein